MSETNLNVEDQLEIQNFSGALKVSVVLSPDSASLCPVCRETAESRHTLTCVSCRAKYHLGCIAESRSRRCGICHSKVMAPASLHTDRFAKGLDWRPTIFWIPFGAAFLVLCFLFPKILLAVACTLWVTFAPMRYHQRLCRDEARAARREDARSRRYIFDARRTEPFHDSYSETELDIVILDPESDSGEFLSGSQPESVDDLEMTPSSDFSIASNLDIEAELS